MAFFWVDGERGVGGIGEGRSGFSGSGVLLLRLW